MIDIDFWSSAGMLWPERDGEMGAFMQKLTITHVQNWQKKPQAGWIGHLYQGRYKSFPVESDDDFYQVARYVERNALRANLVSRAEDWRWSSLWRRVYGQRRGSAEVEPMAVASAACLERLDKSAADGGGNWRPFVAA